MAGRGMCARLLLVAAVVTVAVQCMPTYDVTAFGAVGDGRTKDTAAILGAIAACDALAGECQVLFPAGQYLTAPFNMTSDLFLNVTADAAILGSQDEEDYVVVKPFPSYCQGREMDGPRYGPLVGGNNLTNIAIFGGGTIDGQGEWWWRMHDEGLLNYTRPRLVEFMYGEGILLQDMTVRNSPFWTIHPYTCNDVVVRNCTVTALASSPNTDGIDPDSTTNMLVEDCTIAVSDDCVSVKSGLDYCGRAYGVASANITVRNCILINCDGLAIGSEMSGGVHNITFENNEARFVEDLVRFKTGRGRGGVVSDIFYINNTVKVGAERGIHYDMYYTSGPPTNASATPVIKNVLIDGLTGVAGLAGYYECLPESPCEATLNNVDLIGLPYRCQNVYGNATNSKPRMCYCHEPNCGV